MTEARIVDLYVSNGCQVCPTCQVNPPLRREYAPWMSSLTPCAARLTGNRSVPACDDRRRGPSWTSSSATWPRTCICRPTALRLFHIVVRLVNAVGSRFPVTGESCCMPASRHPLQYLARWCEQRPRHIARRSDPLRVVPPLPPEGLIEVGRARSGEMSQSVCGYHHCDQVSIRSLEPCLNCCGKHPCDTEAEVGLPPLTARAPSAVLAIQSGDWLQTTLRHTI